MKYERSQHTLLPCIRCAWLIYVNGRCIGCYKVCDIKMDGALVLVGRCVAFLYTQASIRKIPSLPKSLRSLPPISPPSSSLTRTVKTLGLLQPHIRLSRSVALVWLRNATKWIFLKFQWGASSLVELCHQKTYLTTISTTSMQQSNSSNSRCVRSKQTRNRLLHQLLRKLLIQVVFHVWIVHLNDLSM